MKKVLAIIPCRINLAFKALNNNSL